ncbi:hypothetical protein Cch01nite_44390 [Cellulomonas chitinilytica]|uniref:Uncharacterized protein n=1 Tax=Cellulomonas chitinilytica TaxID=398759 RepID=A0A919P7J0_9CELL|nr:hypothetical protein Cch01nite_44390 [Cellulomonas chitinilytica]
MMRGRDDDTTLVARIETNIPRRIPDIDSRISRCVMAGVVAGVAAGVAAAGLAAAAGVDPVAASGASGALVVWLMSAVVLALVLVRTVGRTRRRRQVVRCGS